MPDLADGEKVQVKGSGSSVYTLKNVGGVYSCTCPAWLHQSIGIERRTCKHLRAYRGDAEETARVGVAGPERKPAKPRADGESGEDSDSTAPPVLLAHRWEGDVQLEGWWMSEKLDGVRAYWDGTQFLSRLGNRFYPPAWFVEGLPDTPLDGELWGGRKLFQRTVGIVKRQDESELWKELLYVVFDAPSHEGPFEERLAHCEKVLTNASYARVHEHIVCKGEAHLREELARVEALGGEGMMLRKPKSKYEAGRSYTLLKVKTFHDAEAVVVDHAAGTGRHKGRLGALVAELEDGTRFNVGTGFSDSEREAPPSIGSVITFRYQELSDGGVPRFPSYVGQRVDAVWKGKPVRSMAKALPAPTPQPRPAPQPSHAIPSGPAQSQKRRRFEMTDGDTKYFWEIEVQGSTHRVRYGTFEARVKRFDSDSAANEALQTRIDEKLEKGFVEVDD